MSDCQRISCDTTALLKIPNSIPNNNKSSIIYLFSKCTTVRFVSMKEHRQKLFTHTHTHSDVFMHPIEAVPHTRLIQTGCDLGFERCKLGFYGFV